MAMHNLNLFDANKISGWKTKKKIFLLSCREEEDW